MVTRHENHLSAHCTFQKWNSSCTLEFCYVTESVILFHHYFCACIDMGHLVALIGKHIARSPNCVRTLICMIVASITLSHFCVENIEPSDIVQ